MNKFTWIVNALKSLPSVLPSISKHPHAAAMVMMFVIALPCILR